MSRTVLDLPVYASAADQLLQANHHAAAAYGALTSGLAGSGAMAGDDATSEEFSAGYDEAAREAVIAHAELVASFTTLGRLVARSADNHRRADAGSVLGSAEPFDAADPPSLLDGPVDVDPYQPPSSVGSDGEGAPPGWDLVADKLEGWVWPGADVDKLRATARVWRQAGASLLVLPTYCDVAIDALRGQYSPEIPLAVESVSDLGAVADQLAYTCDQLGLACEEYADQVEHHRELVKGILEGLAIEIAATIAAAAVLSAFSGGAAAAGGAGMVTARISAAARRIADTLRALKRLATARAVAGLTSAVLRIGPIRTVVSKFAAARHLDQAAYIRRADDAAELETIVYGKAGGRLGLDEVPAWVGLKPKVRTRWNVPVRYKEHGEIYPVEHIKRGHWPGTRTDTPKGKFHDGITEDQLYEYIEEAVRRGDYDHARGLVRYKFDGDRVIGTNRDGDPTSVIEIYVRDGVLRTAYPA